MFTSIWFHTQRNGAIFGSTSNTMNMKFFPNLMSKDWGLLMIFHFCIFLILRKAESLYRCWFFDSSIFVLEVHGHAWKTKGLVLLHYKCLNKSGTSLFHYRKVGGRKQGCGWGRRRDPLAPWVWDTFKWATTIRMRHRCRSSGNARAMWACHFFYFCRTVDWTQDPRTELHPQPFLVVYFVTGPPG